VCFVGFCLIFSSFSPDGTRILSDVWDAVSGAQAIGPLHCSHEVFSHLTAPECAFVPYTMGAVTDEIIEDYE